MLGLDFEEEITKILEVLPRERTTYLFSATMTNKVKKLQRAALRRPVKVQVNSKYTTVKTLVQQYLFIPEKYKDCYLAFVLNEFAGLRLAHPSLRTPVSPPPSAFPCQCLAAHRCQCGLRSAVSQSVRAPCAAGQTTLCFVRTCNECERLTIMLRSLGFKALAWRSLPCTRVRPLRRAPPHCLSHDACR